MKLATRLALLFWLFVAIIFIFVFKASAAGPYLTCDCTPAADEVTGFQLNFNNQGFIDVPAVDSCGTGTGSVTCATGQKTICYDLGTLPNGPFTVVAKCVNIWEVSNDSAPLSANKVKPSSPSSLGIIKK